MLKFVAPLLAAVLFLTGQTAAAAPSGPSVSILPQAQMQGGLDDPGVLVIVDVICPPGVSRVDVLVEQSNPFTPNASGEGGRFFLSSGQKQRLAVMVFGHLFNVGRATATAMTSLDCATATDAREITISAH